MVASYHGSEKQLLLSLRSSVCSVISHTAASQVNQCASFCQLYLLSYWVIPSLVVVLKLSLLTGNISPTHKKDVLYINLHLMKEGQLGSGSINSISVYTKTSFHFLMFLLSGLYPVYY